VGVTLRAFSDLIRVRRLIIVSLSLSFLAYLLPRRTSCQTSLMMRVRMKMRVRVIAIVRLSP
jgi:hypothetical protein